MKTNYLRDTTVKTAKNPVSSLIGDYLLEFRHPITKWAHKYANIYRFKNTIRAFLEDKNHKHTCT